MTSHPLETNFLVPNGEFFGIFLVLVVGLVLLPLVGALRSGQWIWAILIVLFAPLGGLLWVAWWAYTKLSAQRA